jgi:hypothetical protein
MRCAARCCASVGRVDQRQLTEDSIPAGKSVRGIRALQNLLKDRSGQPHGLSVLKGFGKQLNFQQIVTA